MFQSAEVQKHERQGSRVRGVKRLEQKVKSSYQPPIKSIRIFAHRELTYRIYVIYDIYKIYWRENHVNSDDYKDR